MRDITVDYPRPYADGDENEQIIAAYFANWAEFCVMRNEIFEGLYRGRAATDFDRKDLGTVVSLEERVTEWQSNAPTFGDSSTLSANGVGALQQLTHMRSLYARLILMRTSLQRILQIGSLPAHRLSTTVWDGAEGLCVQMAREIIDALAAFRSNVFILRCRFFTSDYVFVAASVLLAARWHGHANQFDAYWQRALQLISTSLPAVAVRLGALAQQVVANELALNDLQMSLLDPTLDPGGWA